MTPAQMGQDVKGLRRCRDPATALGPGDGGSQFMLQGIDDTLQPQKTLFPISIVRRLGRLCAARGDGEDTEC